MYWEMTPLVNLETRANRRFDFSKRKSFSLCLNLLLIITFAELERYEKGRPESQMSLSRLCACSGRPGRQENDRFNGSYTKY